MESRSGRVVRSDSSAFRDGDIPNVRTPSWGIGTRQIDFSRVSFLHLTDIKIDEAIVYRTHPR